MAHLTDSLEFLFSIERALENLSSLLSGSWNSGGVARQDARSMFMVSDEGCVFMKISGARPSMSTYMKVLLADRLRRGGGGEVVRGGQCC
jgi:hypothetical protein